MREQDWEKMERTMDFILQRQAESAGASAKVDQRLEAIVDQQAEFASNFTKTGKRLERLERLGRQMMAAADRRFKQAEVRLDRLEDGLSELRRDVSDLVNTLRISSRGNGRGN